MGVDLHLRSVQGHPLSQIMESKQGAILKPFKPDPAMSMAHHSAHHASTMLERSPHLWRSDWMTANLSIFTGSIQTTPAKLEDLS